ncbi:hypothetical protein PG984_016225 [Apiospora sp. TS-2023a]
MVDLDRLWSVGRHILGFDLVRVGEMPPMRVDYKVEKPNVVWEKYEGIIQHRTAKEKEKEKKQRSLDSPSTLAAPAASKKWPSIVFTNCIFCDGCVGSHAKIWEQIYLVVADGVLGYQHRKAPPATLVLVGLIGVDAGAARWSAALASGQRRSQARGLGFGVELSIRLVASVRGRGQGELLKLETLRAGNGGSAINVSMAGLNLYGHGPVGEEIRILGRENVVIQMLH